MKWASEETEAFANCFNKHVRSILSINGGLSTVVDSVHFALSYCSLLSSQKLDLQPYLIEHIIPCMKSTLKAHFDHFKKVISIFTSSDVWVMGRYLVSGILIDGSSSLVSEQHPEYCLLTNSGRKLVSLLQAVIEDLSSLVSVFGSSILEELMDLFTEYSFLLERALTYETNDAVEGAPKIKTAESLSQKVSVIANLSTLKYIFSNNIINIFKDINQLETVIDGHMASVSEICSRLQAQLCKQFIHSIMSNEASCIKDHGDFELLQGLSISSFFDCLAASLSSKEEEQPACQDDVLKQSHGNLLLNTLSYPNPTMHNDVVVYKPKQIPESTTHLSMVGDGDDGLAVRHLIDEGPTNCMERGGVVATMRRRKSLSRRQ
ncbi:hypothetical protein R6Q57_017868 [Mikania cordata]